MSTYSRNDFRVGTLGKLQIYRRGRFIRSDLVKEVASKFELLKFTSNTLGKKLLIGFHKFSEPI